MAQKSSLSTLLGKWNEGERGTDDRYTPRWLVDLAASVMGEIDLDPCAEPEKRVPATTHFTKEVDGLEQSWKGRVFLNPPYSNATQWFKHLAVYVAAEEVTEAVVLVPVTALGTRGAGFLMKGTASAMTILNRRVNFLDENHQERDGYLPIPVCLVYVGKNHAKFLDITAPYGYGATLVSPKPNHKHRECQYCGKTFLAQRSTAKFCGSTCRVLSHRKSNAMNS